MTFLIGLCPLFIFYISIPGPKIVLSESRIHYQWIFPWWHPSYQAGLHRERSDGKPQKPQYESTWDREVILNHLRALNKNEDLTLEKLSKKLAILLALVTVQRVQTLSKIHIYKWYNRDFNFNTNQNIWENQNIRTQQTSTYS